MAFFVKPIGNHTFYQNVWFPIGFTQKAIVFLTILNEAKVWQGFLLLGRVKNNKKKLPNPPDCILAADWLRTHGLA